MPSICAVYGCSSSSINKNTILQGVKFYSFSGTQRAGDRMTKWIYFCNRTNPNGTEWKPTKTSKICSLHFVGGSKSEHPLHPAYNPTIHPKPPPKNSQLITAENTFQRAQDRMGKRLSNFNSYKMVQSKNHEETNAISTVDTPQNLHNSQPCCLCFERFPGIPCDESTQAENFKEMLSNLLQVMQISISPVDELFTAPETWNLGFCQKCDKLIQHGLYLKKQLLVIQSDILGQSLRWDPHLDEGGKSKDSTDLPQRFRCELRNRVVACEAKLSEETTKLRNTRRDANCNESNSEEPMEQADSSPLLPASPEEEESLLEHGNISQTAEECTTPTATVPYLPELQLSPGQQSRTDTIESAVVPLATILPARRSAALVSAVKMGTSTRNLDNRFACDNCRTMCSSETILTLHRDEEHGLSEDVKLVYNCEVCHGELNAFMFINHDQPPSKRYSTSINGKMRYFAQFFRLCEAHYSKCAKEQLSSTGTAHSVRTGDAQFVKCKQIDMVGRSEPVVPCLLCHSMCTIESSSITQHYKYFHGLNFRFEDRFSCTGCYTPYESSQPGVGIGKIAPDDLEHFKEFCKQHLLCNETKHSAKSYVCKLCPNFQVFRTPSGIFAHDIKNHTHDEKYSCNICSSRFVEFEDFRAHARKDHKASVRCYCAICSESFQLRRDYLEHVTTVHRKKNSMCVCFVCGSEQKSIPALRRHMHKDHGQNKIKQLLYGCKTLTPRQLEYEAIRKERRSKNVDRIKCTRYFNCFLCDHSLQTAQLLDLHLREMHDPVPGNLNFKCVCGEAFKQTEFLIEENVKHPEYKYPARINLSGKEFAVRTFSEHCNNHVLLCPAWLETKDQPEASSMFKCGKCKKATNSAVDYITHLRSHYADLLKTCYFCDFSINDPKKMDSHIYRIHNLTKACYQQYYCRYCRECYAPKRAELETGRFVMEELDNFKKFGLLHAVCAKTRPEPKKSFKCKFCDKILTLPFDLFKHEIQEHTKSFVAFCDQCGAGYANQPDLNRHIKFHGEKPFKCEQCPAAFLRNSQLIHHNRVHKGERPFVCEKCGKGFHANYHLKVHMQRHRETADIPCTICGHMFRSMPGLRCHLYSIHNVRKKKLAGS